MSSALCIVCKAKQDHSKVFAKIDGGVFLQCSRCGLVWLEQRSWPQDQQKHYSTEYYSEDYRGRDDLDALFQYRFKLLKEYLPSPGRILEIGAASGDFLSLLKEAGYDVSGVELSSRAAAQAAQKYKLNLFQGTLEAAKFPDNYFDYVVMYHVLEHIPDPRALLREVHRILNVGGRILFEVPNVRSVDTRFSQKLLRSVLDYPNHLYAFSRSTLRRLINEEGFATIALEASVPFVISRLFTRPRARPKTASKREEINQAARTSGLAMLRRAQRDSWVKRLVARVVPGMKITIVAQKR